MSTQLHPTVTYGQPGGDQAVVVPQAQPRVPQQPQYGGYQAQGYSTQQLPPAPTPPQPQAQSGYQPGNFYPPVGMQGQQPGPTPQPPQPQYPGPQPQPQPPVQQPTPGYPQPQPQGQPQGQRAYLDPNVILDGPGIPPELRGRTVGQVMGIYSGLAQRFFGGPQPQQGGQQAAPVQPQGQSQGQQPQGQQPQRRGSFFQDPDAYFDQFGQKILQQVDERIAPITAYTVQGQIQSARANAAQSIPDFQHLEADIMETLAGATPQMLANPELWRSTADLVRGRRMVSGTYQPPQQGQQQYGQPGYGQQAQPPRSVPAGMTVLPQHTFFTEGPTAPAQQPVVQLSAQDRFFMQKFGMNEQDWVAWKYGVQGQQQNGQYAAAGNGGWSGYR